MSYDDICERISLGEFENKIEFPDRPLKPRLGSNPTAADARRFADELELFETLMLKYDNAIKSFHKGQINAEARFEAALADEYYLKNHPKRDMVYSVARAMATGCGGGDREVAAYYHDLANLFL